MPDWRVLAAVLAWVAVLGPLSVEGMVGILASTAAAFPEASLPQEWILTAFLAGSATLLAWGPLGDRVGRRATLLGGLALYLGGTALCLLAPSFRILLLGRFLQAAGVAANAVQGQAIVRDSSEGERTVTMFQVLTGALFAGSALGPVAGGLLASAWGWRAVYLALLLWAGGGLVLVLAVVPETRKAGPRSSGGPAAVFREGQFRRCAGVAALAFTGMFAYVGGSSALFVERLGLSPTSFGLLYVLVVTGYGVGLAMARGTRRLDLGPRLLLGALPGAAAGAGLVGQALAGATGLPGAAVCCFLFYLSLGMVVPVATAGALQPFPSLAGTAASWLGFLQALSGTFATWIVLRLSPDPALAVGLVFLATALAAMALAAGLVDHEAR